MSSTMSSVRSSPIPDLAYDSYRAMSLNPRGQNLVKRNLSGGHNGHTTNGSGPSKSVTTGLSNNEPRPSTSTANVNFGFEPTHNVNPRQRFVQQDEDENNMMKQRTIRLDSSLVQASGAIYSLDAYSAETIAFWFLLCVLIILVIGNTILTCVVFGVLRMGAGMESIEVFPGALKFYGETDLDEIYKRDGVIEGLHDEPVEISGEDGGQVNFWVHEGSQPSLSVARNIVNISQVSEFRIEDDDGLEVFSTNTPTLGLPRGVQKLDVRIVKANRITSAVNDSLQISSTIAYLMGSEGTHMDGRQITWKADQDIYMKTINGKLILTGENGVYINVHELPLVRGSVVTKKSYTYSIIGKQIPQYQLCICMPQGKLYKVEIPLDNHKRSPDEKIGCHSALNPCGNNN